MRRFSVVLFCLLLLGVVACYGGDASDGDQTGASPASRSSPGPSFAAGKVIIDMGEDSVLVDVEIAQTPEQREYGLMNRESLDPDSGMVFLYLDGNSTSSFYMKNTRIPLSVAFFDIDGRILEILDMEPCLEEPCPTYNPGVAYRGALEVNRGAFDRWGVSTGDTITLVHT